jgi:diketogulonate reductase-like aldo/keto reductase
MIVPIPGTRKLERLEENVGSVDLKLTSEDLSRIAAETSKIPLARRSWEWQRELRLKAKLRLDDAQTGSWLNVGP